MPSLHNIFWQSKVGWTLNDVITEILVSDNQTIKIIDKHRT